MQGHQMVCDSFVVVAVVAPSVFLVRAHSCELVIAGALARVQLMVLMVVVGGVLLKDVVRQSEIVVYVAGVDGKLNGVMAVVVEALFAYDGPYVVVVVVASLVGLVFGACLGAVVGRAKSASY